MIRGRWKRAVFNQIIREEWSILVKAVQIPIRINIKKFRMDISIFERIIIILRLKETAKLSKVTFLSSKVSSKKDHNH